MIIPKTMSITLTDISCNHWGWFLRAMVNQARRMGYEVSHIQAEKAGAIDFFTYTAGNFGLSGGQSEIAATMLSREPHEEIGSWEGLKFYLNTNDALNYREFRIILKPGT